ncbi:MAG: Gfo/Idh/MocA family oxidoreductase [Flavobacteriaceae bacterium]|nr:Gfo/Idh/MocA family oxidoreductase [Flavobacteriaceae bacterium]
MAEKILNVGVIGYGLSGRVFHAPFIHIHPGFLLKKIVERSTKESKKKYPYVEVVSDYKNLLQDISIDIIAVCSPNSLHFKMAKECLLAGKHVIVEKPFTTSSKEADELIDISKRVAKKIFVYQNRRWDADFLTIKSILKNNALGKIYEYEAHFDRFKPEYVNLSWKNIKSPGSGNLYDLGSHLIDQAIDLFGKPNSLEAIIKTERKNSPIDDYFKLVLNYTNLKVVLTAGMLIEDLGPRYIIKGSKGIFTKFGIDPQEDVLKKGILPNSKTWGKEDKKYWGTIISDKGKKVIESLPGNYMGFYDNVYEVLKDNAEIVVKPEEVLETIKIIETAFSLQKVI